MWMIILLSGVIGLGGLSVYTLTKICKDLTDEQVQQIMKELQEVQYKIYM